MSDPKLDAPVYEYEILPYDDVCALLRFCDEPDAYVSEDSIQVELKRILAAGFRWVRSEGDHAIFERVTTKIPDQFKHEKSNH